MGPWKLSLLSPGIASFIPKAVIVFLIPNEKHSGFIENHERSVSCTWSGALFTAAGSYGLRKTFLLFILLAECQQ